MNKNRLASEKSPYLRQHAENPVDWYPWGPEAFERARREDKPILLSVGYSACHWCHVMAHESFESPAIAEQMNAGFINIKVDREEHPDVDQVYQQVAQMITRGGGWPLTVFLTPELKPYFGGTYYPPEDRYGRPGFPRVLESMSRAYREQRADVEENARRLLEAMQDDEGTPGLRATTREETFSRLKIAAERLVGIVDWQNGGVGSAPKFPNVMAISFLWRSGLALDLAPSRQAAILALVRMAEGGIFDQLGGGFHRYSVDEAWAVPHFEKMLYDNALLLRLYSEVLLTAGDELAPEVRTLFSQVVAETVAYVLREMTTAQGAFYSAQDADSEGEEGKFFVWTPAELSKVLDPDEARVFSLRYGVNETGNFEHGASVLAIGASLEEISEATGLAEAQVRENLAFACAKLKSIRDRRVWPGLDDKILVAWNGLMISGLAWASRALDSAGSAHASLAHRAAIAGHRALDWIQAHAVGANPGELRSVLTAEGDARIAGRLDDSAYMARAALDLLRFLPEESLSHRGPLLKKAAAEWVESAWKRFVDAESGRAYLTEAGNVDLVHRPRSFHDQAIPAGVSVLMDCVLELSELGCSMDGVTGADDFIASWLDEVQKNPFGLAEAASVLLKQALGPVVLKGAGSLVLQGHFCVMQDQGSLGSSERPVLQICQDRSCTLEPGGHAVAAQVLRKRLVPGLQ